MKAINFSTALSMSLLALFTFLPFLHEAAPTKTYRGGVVVTIEPFAANPIDFLTQMDASNKQSTTYLAQIFDENGLLCYQVSTESLHIILPSTVQITSGYSLVISAPGYSESFVF